MTIRMRLIVISLVLNGFTAVIPVLFFFGDAQKRVVEGYVEKSCFILLSDESAREEMANVQDTSRLIGIDNTAEDEYPASVLV